MISNQLAVAAADEVDAEARLADAEARLAAVAAEVSGLRLVTEARRKTTGIRSGVAYRISEENAHGGAVVSPVGSDVPRGARIYLHLTKQTWFVNVRDRDTILTYVTVPNPHRDPGLTREQALETAIAWVTTGDSALLELGRSVTTR